jgi:hypothetical protein
MKRFGSAGWSGGFRENGVIQPFTYSDSHVFTPKSNRRLTNDQIQNA